MDRMAVLFGSFTLIARSITTWILNTLREKVFSLQLAIGYRVAKVLIRYTYYIYRVMLVLLVLVSIIYISI